MPAVRPKRAGGPGDGRAARYRISQTCLPRSRATRVAYLRRHRSKEPVATGFRPTAAKLWRVQKSSSRTSSLREGIQLLDRTGQSREASAGYCRRFGDGKHESSYPDVGVRQRRSVAGGISEQLADRRTDCLFFYPIGWAPENSRTTLATGGPYRPYDFPLVTSGARRNSGLVDADETDDRTACEIRPLTPGPFPAPSSRCRPAPCRSTSSFRRSRLLE